MPSSSTCAALLHTSGVLLISDIERPDKERGKRDGGKKEGAGYARGQDREEQWILEG